MNYWMYEADLDFGTEYIRSMEVNQQTGEVTKGAILRSRDLYGDDDWNEEGGWA